MDCAGKVAEVAAVAGLHRQCGPVEFESTAKDEPRQIETVAQVEHAGDEIPVCNLRMNDVMGNAMTGRRQQQTGSNLTCRRDHLASRQKPDVTEVAVDFHTGLGARAHHRRVVKMSDFDVYSARFPIPGIRQRAHRRFKIIGRNGEVDVAHHPVGRRQCAPVEQPGDAFEQCRPQSGTCQYRADTETLQTDPCIAFSIAAVQQSEILLNVLWNDVSERGPREGRPQRGSDKMLVGQSHGR
jgi:hypothetical protein